MRKREEKELKTRKKHMKLLAVYEAWERINVVINACKAADKTVQIGNGKMKENFACGVDD